MHIIKATISHAEDIHQLHGRAVRETCKDFYSEIEIEAWLKGRSAEGYYKGIENGEMYVVEDEGVVAGFGHAIPGEIAAIYVDPAFHKKGVGRMLINHGLEIASKGHKKVKVDSSLNAEGFYAKHGFVKVKDSTCIRNGMELPVVVMEWVG